MEREAERFLAKARESRASAEADLEAGRYNSCANRAYYAAFQAAVAALIHTGIRHHEKSWPHKFVNSEFSGKLVRRRKLLDSELASTLGSLFETRVKGDYKTIDVSSSRATRSVAKATRLVKGVDNMTKLQTLKEATARYEAGVQQSRELANLADTRIQQVQAFITAEHPEARYDILRFGPTDYRINAYLDQQRFEQSEDFHDALNGLTTDILIDDDIWIVVIDLDIEELSQN